MKRVIIIIITLLVSGSVFSQIKPTNPVAVPQMTWYKDINGHMWAFRGSTLGYIQMLDSTQIAGACSGCALLSVNNVFTGNNSFNGGLSVSNFTPVFNSGLKLTISPTGSNSGLLMVADDGTVSSLFGKAQWDNSTQTIIWHGANSNYQSAVSYDVAPDFNTGLNLHNLNDFTNVANKRVLVYAPGINDMAAYVPFMYFANDTTVVHKTGNLNETVTGDKTYTGKGIYMGGLGNTVAIDGTDNGSIAFSNQGTITGRAGGGLRFLTNGLFAFGSSIFDEWMHLESGNNFANNWQITSNLGLPNSAVRNQDLSNYTYTRGHIDSLIATSSTQTYYTAPTSGNSVTNSVLQNAIIINVSRSGSIYYPTISTSPVGSLYFNDPTAGSIKFQDNFSSAGESVLVAYKYLTITISGVTAALKQYSSASAITYPLSSSFVYIVSDETKGNIPYIYYAPQGTISFNQLQAIASTPNTF